MQRERQVVEAELSTTWMKKKEVIPQWFLYQRIYFAQWLFLLPCAGKNTTQLFTLLFARVVRTTTQQLCDR